MPREDALLRMNTAIRSCLDRCYKVDQPLVALAAFVAELRRRPEWRQAEVEEVETTVRRILQAVVRRREEQFPGQSAGTEACTGSASEPTRLRV